MICRFCGSQNIVWDHSYGRVICASCGAVLEDMIEDQVQNFIILRAGSRRSRAEPPQAPPELLNKKALRTLSSEEEIREIYYVLNRNPILKARTLRVKVAIAVYAHRRASGYSKNRARRDASSMAGVSVKSIMKLERGHRDIVEALVEKVRTLRMSAARA